MNWKLNGPPLAFGLIAVIGLGAFTQWRLSFALLPHPDWAHLGAYQSALERSRHPKAIAIRRQIDAGPADLARERAQAQREGVPVDISQLQPPPPPASENAAVFYDRWNALRRSRPMRTPVYATPLSGRYAYTPSQIALIQNTVAAHADLFTLLHQATDRPRCVFTSGLKDPITGLTYASASPLREAARELVTESFLLAHAGRLPEAVATQARGFRVAEHAASQPTLIGYLVGNAIEAITLSGLKNLLTLAGPNAAADDQIRQTIAARRSRLSIKKAMSGEVAITLKTLDYCRPLKPADLISLLQPGSVTGSSAPAGSRTGNYSPDERRFLSHLLDAAEAEGIRRTRPLIAVADQPPYARRAAFAPYVGMTLDSTLTVGKPTQVDPVQAVLDAVAPIFSDINDNDARLKAQEQVIMATAVALAARARQGAYPLKLPNTYTDPFTGKPLGYRREGKDGFVVYSVGPDGAFNGGKPGDVPTSKNILFRYPAPALQPVPPEMLK